jgi:hypothetical protein
MAHGKCVQTSKLHQSDRQGLACVQLTFGMVACRPHTTSSGLQERPSLLKPPCLGAAGQRDINVDAPVFTLHPPFKDTLSARFRMGMGDGVQSWSLSPAAVLPLNRQLGSSQQVTFASGDRAAHRISSSCAGRLCFAEGYFSRAPVCAASAQQSISMAPTADSDSSPAIVKKLSLREVAQRFEAGDAAVLEASMAWITVLDCAWCSMKRRQRAVDLWECWHLLPCRTTAQ